MVFCTNCGGSVESTHDYCYSCGNRIEHPERVTESAPVENMGPTVIKSAENDDVSKNQSERKYDWGWIIKEVVLLAVLLLGLPIFIGGGTAGITSLLVAAAVVVTIGTYMAGTRGEIREKENEEAGRIEHHITPIWMRIVGIVLMAVGMLLTIDFLIVVVAGLTGNGFASFWFVDASAPGPIAFALLLGVVGAGFLARWGFHVAGGQGFLGELSDLHGRFSKSGVASWILPDWAREFDIPTYECTGCGRRTAADSSEQCFYCRTDLPADALVSGRTVSS